MDVAPLGPVPAWARVWETLDGHAFATLACKATFTLGPGVLGLAEEQLPVHEKDTAYAPSDLVPCKRGVDVVLVGSAFPPRARQGPSFAARLQVAAIDKRVAISRALEHIDAGRRSGIPIADFGPLLPTSTVRSSKLRAGDWPFEQWHEHKLPVDLDASFFNAAPLDQQLRSLEPDARIVLEHLHPIHERLEACLPGAVPIVFVERHDQGAEWLDMACDTLWIDTDRNLCSLTWRGHITLARVDEPMRCLIAFGKASDGIRYKDIDALRDASGLPPWSSQDEEPTYDPRATVRLATGARIPDATVSMSELIARAVMPFVRPTGEERRVAPPAPLAALDTGTADLSAMLVNAPRVAGSPWSRLAEVAPEFTSKAAPRPLAAGEGLLSAVEAARDGAIAYERAKQTRDHEVEAAAPARDELRTELTIVKLLWLDEGEAARLIEQPDWRLLIAELELRRLEEGLDDNASSKAETLRRQTLEVLTRGEPRDADGIHHAAERAIDPEGVFVPPLLLTAGELLFPFDEIAALKATLTVIRPLATSDKNLRAVVEEADELLAAPALDGAAGIAEAFTQRLRDELKRAARNLPPDYVTTHAQRMLLSQRAYQRRTLYGKSWIRALLMGSDKQGMPCYLPNELSDQLPLFQSFQARMVVEVDLREDQHETHPLALKAIALGRKLEREALRS